MRLQNKIVIITGGSLGIGKAACILLAKEGAKIAITDVLDTEGNKLADEIKAMGFTAKYWHMDVSDEKEVKKITSEIHDEFGKIDVLVNNAAILGDSKPVHELTSEEWDKVMNINVKGVFYCIKYIVPYMLSSGSGSIINLSSIYGLISAIDVPAYHASKGALRLMTKTDALYYAKNNIRVNSIHPGFIMTPMVDNFIKSSGDYEGTLNTLNALHPVGHLGEPDDIAYGILYLASDESKFITGSELVIDGGYTAR